MIVLEDLRYIEGHVWARAEDGNTVVIGLTDYGQQRLGKIFCIDLPEEGEEVVKDDVFGTVDGPREVEDLYTPLTGRVIAVNEAVSNNPELVNDDPYEAGWLLRIEITQPEEWEELFAPDEYTEFVEEQRLAGEEGDVEEEDLEVQEE
jgi:glycine cleavage system H protein